MRKLVSTLSAALVVLCAVTMGADVKHDAAAPPPSSSCAVPQASAIKTVGVVRRADLPVNRMQRRPAAQVTRNDRADVTFEVRATDDGGVQVVGKSGDLQFTKTVRHEGGFVLDLATDKDRVSISASGQGTTVTRGKSTIALPRGSTTEAKNDGARRLLADSKAVLQFRRVSAALIDAEDRSGPALAMVIGDAAIGQLTGDVGAARRAAKHLAHQGASNARPAALRPECFQTMEADMMFALNDYGYCLMSVWGNSLYEDLCAWRWIVEVESVWFQFIACSGLGGIF